ncbi:hypothetical protein FB566_0279 [Stackebrandtia endophytica]|uniref:Uncharacterized protein n=2 Tax=Stackebrandtia endophytica TaxID=1496996 RepID=A0A543AQC2_9ACTN|nr:hypothetical protein FB566_0279 [Stackebrandtia endophytica]
MWIQVVVLVVTGAGTLNTIRVLQGLSDKELVEQTEGMLTSQADIDYTTGWIITICLFLLAASLAWCAWKLTTRTRQIRLMTVTTEGLLATVVLVTMPSLCNLFLIVLPAIVVIVVLFRDPAKSWFIDTRQPPAGGAGTTD